MGSSPEKIFKFKHQGSEIDIKLKESPKRRSVAISIKPSKEILVTTPKKMPHGILEELLRTKLPWIQRKLYEIDKITNEIPEHTYKDEDVHLFLGEKYRLKIEVSEKENIYLNDDNIIVQTNAPNNELKIKHLLNNWYWEKAKEILKIRFEEKFRIFNTFNLPNPILTIERSKTRWGQCSRSKHIKLNKELIKTPLECIDYVIFHELCHLKELNHGPRFYGLLERYIPNWKKIKNDLKKHGNIILV